MNIKIDPMYVHIKMKKRVRANCNKLCSLNWPMCFRKPNFIKGIDLLYNYITVTSVTSITYVQHKGALVRL